MITAQAYVYAGAWVADCPSGCGNVEYLFDQHRIRKSVFHCSYCLRIADIEWCPNEAEIMGVLAVRPIPHTRNWYPFNHDVALRFGLPHGQSVADLVDENHEHGVL